VELARGRPVAPAQASSTGTAAPPRAAWGAPSTDHRLAGGARVAAAAGPGPVLLVAEVAQEMEASGSRGVGEVEHLVELLFLCSRCRT